MPEKVPDLPCAPKPVKHTFAQLIATSVNKPVRENFRVQLAQVESK